MNSFTNGLALSSAIVVMGVVAWVILKLLWQGILLIYYLI